MEGDILRRECDTTNTHDDEGRSGPQLLTSYREKETLSGRESTAREDSGVLKSIGGGA